MNTENRTIEQLCEGISTPLEMFYHFEQSRADKTCFVQPYPDGSIVNYSWQSAGDQIRRLAAYLESLELPAGSNIALMSTNCAYWLILRSGWRVIVQCRFIQY